MSEQKWVVLDQVPGELQAEILKGLLEANGISVFLSQEGAGKVYGMTVAALGSVEILVPEQSLPQARQLIDDYESGKLIDSLDDISDETESDD
jgi:hypothetical protein